MEQLPFTSIRSKLIINITRLNNHRDCVLIYRAVHGGHLEVANLLLDRGCQLDVADLNGDTVLHLADRSNHTDILAVLLRKGANPDLKNKVNYKNVAQIIVLRKQKCKTKKIL